MRHFLVFLITTIAIILLIVFLGEPASAETLYVSIREGTYLNGREFPSTKSRITMRLFNGDSVEAISFNGEWVEVRGGESGTSFIKSQYLSELTEPVYYENISGGRVRARKTPQSSRVAAWIAAGETVKISRQIMGWGYTHGGWVDLSYFESKEERE